MSVQRAHVISGVDADSVVQQRSEEEEENEAGGVAAGRRVVVSQCTGESALSWCGGVDCINEKVILRAARATIFAQETFQRFPFARELQPGSSD